MGQFDGKVVYITGIARGQGRKHAIRFAREGARIIGLDLCDSPSEYVKYRAATEDDLATTIERVEAEGGEILAEVEALVDYYRKAAGEHPDWDEYRRVMVADRRVLMVMSVDRVYGERLR